MLKEMIIEHPWIVYTLAYIGAVAIILVILFIIWVVAFEKEPPIEDYEIYDQE